MKAESILQSDMLDIIFEHRNKMYGAYELRRHYNQRLKKSLAVVFSVFVLVVAGGYLGNRFSPHKNILTPFIIDDSLRPIIIQPDRQIIHPPVRNKSLLSQATAPNVTMRIVKDNTIDSTTMPAVDEANQKTIGTQNTAEEISGDGEQGPANNEGRGKEAPQPGPEATESVLKIAEVMPEFPGGMAALQRFLSRNLKTPKDDMEAGAMVRVLARFVVDKDGSITGIEIEQSGGTDFDNEVSRVIKKMPSWKPGKQNGRNVSVYFNIPVVFQAEGD